MIKPKYLIEDICNINNIIEIKKKLLLNGIKIKDYDKENLLLIYNNYNISIKSDLQRECRSLVLDKTSFKIIAYSCETPLINNDGLDYIKYNNTLEYVTTCYEGTCLSLFNHNNNWYLSSRKLLRNIINNNHIYDMFLEVLNESGYDSFDQFTLLLDKKLSYYFVLIHFNNKNIIDYSNIFNNQKYKKLVLFSVKDSDMQENINLENINFLGEHIFLPNINTLNNFFLTDLNNIKYNTIPECEGIIVNKWDNKTNKFKLIKLQYSNYIYYSLLRLNINYGLIFLYQINMLINNNNVYELNLIFNICTFEIFEIFKLFFDFKTGNKIELQNNELSNKYTDLPKEFKYMLFKLRGIIYRNKQTLTFNNINKLLKKIPPTFFISLLKSRSNLEIFFMLNKNIINVYSQQQLKIYNEFINKL